MKAEAARPLAEAVERARVHAAAAGALVPVEVEGDTVEDHGVAFRVEWLSSLAMKDLAAKVPRPGDKAIGFNPFLPFEQDLWVADLSPTHVAILNKFPVFPGHLVMITRDFVEQELPLGQADVEAVVLTLAGLGGLMFFNSGAASGASQRHRHLQLIPGFEPPIEVLLDGGAPLALGRAARVPYDHVFCRLDPSLFDDPAGASGWLGALVSEACAAAGLDPVDGRCPPWNLLMTREWLMVIPRRAEFAAGVSLSGLGYAGHMGLRSPEQLADVRAYGPMRMLSEAAGAWEG